MMKRIMTTRKKAVAILGLLGASTLLVSCLMKFSEKPDICFDQQGNKTYGIGGDVFGGQVYPILKEKCSGCHGANGHADAPSLKLGSAEQAYSTLVNQATFQSPTVTPNVLIVPKNLEQSYLYQKISNDKPKFGVRMPQGGVLTAAEIKIIGDWILAGAPKPGSGGSGSASNGLITCSAPCDAEIAKDRNSTCHPCNSANPPAYCVNANFFRDTIINYLVLKCASCHFNNTTGGASANLVFDTAQDPTRPTTLEQRYTFIYDNIVGSGSFVRGAVYPVMRVAPSDLNSSLMYQAITTTDSMISANQKDAIADSLQYKLSSKMPPFGLYGEVSTDEPLPEHPFIGHLRNWILSGAPGPGDLTNLQALKDIERREKFVRDSIEQKRILDSLMNALGLSKPAKKK